MENELLQDVELLRKVFDVMPVLVFIVDRDLRIEAYNSTAFAFLGESPEKILKERGGEVFHCIHSTETPEGCGHSEACKDCDVRNSVYQAIEGKRVIRKNTEMTLKKDEAEVNINVAITALPLDYKDKDLYLLMIEDIGELIQLRSILPICAKCKKVRNDKDYWGTVESYFEEHSDVSFSHGLCPDCAKEVMKDIE